MFGISVPEQLKAECGEPVRYWGARAILENGSFSILPDRRTQNFPQSDYDIMLFAGSKAVTFIEWLDECLAELKKRPWDPASNEVVTMKRGARYTLMASPKGSYGYLYIGAWEYPVTGVKADLTTPDTTATWSGGNRVPNLGAKVKFRGAVTKKNKTTMKKLTGSVVSYFVQDGYLGVRIKADDRFYGMFGMEIEEVI